jgi:hypothetical protein
MSAIILKLFDIMRLRGGPQDLPEQMPQARTLAVILALVYIAEGFIADSILGEPDTAPRSLLAITVQFVIVIALLNWRGMVGRMMQTIAAIAGVGAIFGLLSVVLILQADNGENQPLLALVWVSAFLWSLAVDAHIYRHALSVSMSQGVLVAVVIFAFNFLVGQWVFVN